MSAVDQAIKGLIETARSRSGKILKRSVKDVCDELTLRPELVERVFLESRGVAIYDFRVEPMANRKRRERKVGSLAATLSFENQRKKHQYLEKYEKNVGSVWKLRGIKVRFVGGRHVDLHGMVFDFVEIVGGEILNLGWLDISNICASLQYLIRNTDQLK